MELRARTRPLRRAALVAAALLVPAVAGTSTAQAAKAPVVKRITPKHVFVGETLTVHGRYFRRGLNKNTVAFKRAGAKAVFVKAEKGTAKLLKVKLPKRLESVLLIRNGTPIPTNLQIRVLSTKFGKRYTSKRVSPIVGAEKPPAPPKPPAVDPNGDCDVDGLKNSVETDDDDDLLSDAQEKSLKLDSCHVDSDRDGVEDGYEYRSALDLNDDEHDGAGQSTPYPEKRPYPNGLDKTDANTDHDGDSLSLKDEYDLWNYAIRIRKGAGRTLSSLDYSAGEQHSVKDASGHPNLAAADYDKQDDFLAWAKDDPDDPDDPVYLPVLLAYPGNTIADGPFDGDDWWVRSPYGIVDVGFDFDRDGNAAETATYYDRNGNGVLGNGVLDDGERDEDADGLPNQWESSGCMVPEYWPAVYDKETKYYVNYGGVRLDDEDTDGDGVRDGADDQDHDDVPNVMECSRVLAHGAVAGFDAPDLDLSLVPSRPWRGFVNPFNPCLPHPESRTCRRYVSAGGTIGKWAPFNPDEDYYLIRN